MQAWIKKVKEVTCSFCHSLPFFVSAVQPYLTISFNTDSQDISVYLTPHMCVHVVKSHSFAALHYNECKTIPDLNLSFTVCGLSCIVFILACNFRSLPLYKSCSDTTEYIEVSRLRIGLSASLNRVRVRGKNCCCKSSVLFW